ncbi:MAG: transglycosylase domain-containing protein [Bacteroidales bacterium]
MRGRRVIEIILAAYLAAALLLISSCNGGAGHLKSREELLNFRNSSASLVYSDEGKLIGKFFSEERTNISFNQIPVHLRNALIATEDVRFYEHGGNDVRSLFRVLVKSIMLNRRSSGGGSTITQQLAKNIIGRINKGSLSIIANKTREAIIARRLEKVFTKDEILTLYLNTVSFGENVFGVEAASERYFNRKASDLEIGQAAVLVGMLKANTYYNPRLNPENAKARRNVVIRQMEKYNYLDRQTADSLCLLPLVLDYNNTSVGGKAGYYLFQVRSEVEKILGDIKLATGKTWIPETDGLVIETALNLQLQDYALQSFRAHLPAMQNKLKSQYESVQGKQELSDITEKELKRLNLERRKNNITYQEIFDWKGSYPDSLTVRDSLEKALTLLHAGLLAMDPETGAVRAWVGGIDFRAQPYDQVLARRQLGSVFKPAIYAEAVEEGMEPCQYLDNDSVILSGFEDWSPENYDHSYGGKYSLAGALAQSMNVPTFSLFLRIGFQSVDSMWHKLGFSFKLSNNPSVAMGTAEASIKEVAAAYSVFANGGYAVSPWYIKSIKTPDGEVIFERENSDRGVRVITEKTCILMNAMLQKAITEGTGASVRSTYGVSVPLAGKTGTSQNYGDAWFAVYNPGLVIVSRVGASTPLIHFKSGANGTGSALALPLVALTLRKAQNDSQLRNLVSAGFPELPPELNGALDCPDFREKNFFDDLIDVFKGQPRPYRKEPSGTEKNIRSFLRKIFRK